MASLVLPSLECCHVEEKQNLNKFPCNSPISTFGNDFKRLLQSALIDRKSKEAEFMEEENEEKDPANHRQEDFNDVNITSQILETLPTEQDAEKGNTELIAQEMNNTRLETSQKTTMSASPTGECITHTQQTTRLTGKKYEIDMEFQKYSSLIVKKKKKWKHKETVVKDTEKISKWKEVPISDVDFISVSLFPRPVVSTNCDLDNNVRLQCYEIETELDEMEARTKDYPKLLALEGKFSNCENIRKDRDRKKIKARIQVKDKYCKSVKNNKAKIKLFINHRIYKMISLEIRTTSYLPSPVTEKILVQRQKYQNNPRSVPKTLTPRSVYGKPAPPQNLAYAIDQHNAPSDLDSALLTLLITLQHRDVTPEDYDMLLRLDEGVAPKTVSSSVIDSFKSDVVDEAHVQEMCAVCMEHYAVGESRKHLPCGHVFHSHCIEMWLKNSSMNCPVDNLPVDPS